MEMCHWRQTGRLSEASAFVIISSLCRFRPATFVLLGLRWPFVVGAVWPNIIVIINLLCSSFNPESESESECNSSFSSNSSSSSSLNSSFNSSNSNSEHSAGFRAKATLAEPPAARGGLFQRGNMRAQSMTIIVCIFIIIMFASTFAASFARLAAAAAAAAAQLATSRARSSKPAAPD